MVFRDVVIVRTIEGLPANDFCRGMRKKDKNNSWFYVVELREIGKKSSFLKVGTTEKTLHSRFSMDDYQSKYSCIRILFAVELEGWEACYQLEDMTKAFLRMGQGYSWVKNDRFRFFQLPDELPLYAHPLHQLGTLHLVKSTKEKPRYYHFSEISD